MIKFLETLLQVIPEAIYDLIARILPGSIVFAVVAKSCEFQMLGLTASTDPGALEVVVFCAFAYATGVAISTLTHPIHWLAWVFLSQFLKSGNVLDRLTRNLPKDTSNNENIMPGLNPIKAQIVLGRIHDLIKKKSPQDGSLLTKLFAEVSLLYGMTIATTFAFWPVENCTWRLSIPVAFFVAGFIRSLRTWYRHESILSAIQQN